MYFRDGGMHSFKGNKTSLNLVNLGESVKKEKIIDRGYNRFGTSETSQKQPVFNFRMNLRYLIFKNSVYSGT